MSVRKSARKRSLSYKAELNSKLNPEGCYTATTPIAGAKESPIAGAKESPIASAREVPTASNDPSENALEHVCSMLPGRSVQAGLLLRLLAPEAALPACLYVHGSHSTGKTLTLSTVLRTLEVKHVMVNCRDCYYSELLFTEILSELAGAGDSVGQRCCNVHSFLTMFRQLACIRDHVPVCIVLDNADILRTDPLLLSTLKRLAELSGSCRVCVVLVSVMTMKTFLQNIPTLCVLPIHFPQYSKEESLQIMSLDCPSHLPRPFYGTFVHHVWNVFNTVCRDLAELRHLGSVLFPKYVEPVEKGDIGYQETHRLWKQIEPYFRTVMSRVYLHEMSNLEEVASSSSSLPELPLCSKYLLLASYIASYNPSRTDRRIFSKLRQAKAHKSRKVAGTELADHSGPKDFTMDRVMALFYSITLTDTPITQLHSQVSTLVALQLLARSSKTEALDSSRYKCLVDLATAQQLAKNVGFDLIHHLHCVNALN